MIISTVHIYGIVPQINVTIATIPKTIVSGATLHHNLIVPKMRRTLIHTTIVDIITHEYTIVCS